MQSSSTVSSSARKSCCARSCKQHTNLPCENSAEQPHSRKHLMLHTICIVIALRMQCLPMQSSAMYCPPCVLPNNMYCLPRAAPAAMDMAMCCMPLAEPGTKPSPPAAAA